MHRQNQNLSNILDARAKNIDVMHLTKVASIFNGSHVENDWEKSSFVIIIL